jgi:hypothetical protein
MKTKVIFPPRTMGMLCFRRQALHFHKSPIPLGSLYCIDIFNVVQCFFFFLGRIFATWRQRKRAGESNNKGILKILKNKIRHILKKKNLEVARFRQWVPVGRQN